MRFLAVLTVLCALSSVFADSRDERADLLEKAQAYIKQYEIDNNTTISDTEADELYTEALKRYHDGTLPPHLKAGGK